MSSNGTVRAGSQHQSQNQPIVRLLMVCLGNICRSPTAHGVMEKLIADRHLHELVEVDSAGTGNYHVGESPDSRASAAALKRGYDLGSQRARQVTAADFAAFDHIIAMDNSNFTDLHGRCPPEYQHKLRLLLEFSQADQNEVPDPYWSGQDGFELVLDLVEDACAALLDTVAADLRRS